MKFSVVLMKWCYRPTYGTEPNQVNRSDIVSLRLTFHCQLLHYKPADLWENVMFCFLNSFFQRSDTFQSLNFELFKSL